MFRLSLPIILVIGLLPGLASNAQAQDRTADAVNLRAELERVEALYGQFDEEALRQPPIRDFAVQTTELKKRKLFRADPKLLENKFVAGFTLRPRDRSQFRPLPSSSYPPPIVNRMVLDRGSLGSGLTGRTEDFQGLDTPRQFFKALVDHCPAEHRPPAAEFFASAEVERDIQMTNTESGILFTIYAPTAEAARHRAEELLRLHDGAVSRPLQQHFLAEGRQLLTTVRAKCDEHDRLRAELDAEREKLKEPSEVSTDILTDLKAQRIMVAIELAGLAARVKACDQMLSPPKSGETKRLEAGALQAISDMKVKAEIERVGTQEKLDRINAFIAEGERRQTIQNKIAALTRDANIVHNTALSDLQQAGAHAIRVEYYAPRQLTGDAIIIAPVEWTE